jgi:hypothetical protein
MNEFVVQQIASEVRTWGGKLGRQVLTFVLRSYLMKKKYF